MNPDAIISVRFLTKNEGGRKTAIQGNFYGCPLFIDNEAFDCRLLLDGKRLELGEYYEIPIKFLFPEFALPLIQEGMNITLWEGKTVATAKIIKILAKI
ncbi:MULTISPECIES: hypothetical protein [unclassified Delftia]|uniref:hypothetical protein n=1 Tax=unclassified Delftia TaxID=2613839 RepID=UPI0012E07468|nr:MULTISPECIES: hypothetical protein [unclassified Delftia]MDC2860799.1 hypothetical protein [Delftia sp. DT-2]